jgi:hypothetical protein
MDEQRFQTLLKKRDETGLSDEEADELGRMFAEREAATTRTPRRPPPARPGTKKRPPR